MEYNKRITLKDGSRCILRNPEPEEAKEILEHLRKTSSETEYMLRYPDEITTTEQQEGNYLQYIKKSSSSIMIAAVINEKIVSNASITPVAEVSKCRHRGEVGISIQKEHWGKGIGTATMEALLEVAKDAGYEQLELEVVTENDRAVALYQKFGFQIYGTRRHSFKCRDGGYKELHLMSCDL